MRAVWFVMWSRPFHLPSCHNLVIITCHSRSPGAGAQPQKTCFFPNTFEWQRRFNEVFCERVKSKHLTECAEGCAHRRRQRRREEPPKTEGDSFTPKALLGGASYQLRNKYLQCVLVKSGQLSKVRTHTHCTGAVEQHQWSCSDTQLRVYGYCQEFLDFIWILLVTI